MKKLFLIIPSGLLFCCISCNNEKASSGSNALAEKNLSAVHGIDKAIETGDISKLGDYIAADAIDHTGETGEVKGLDSIKASLAIVHTMGTDMKSEVLKELADSFTVMQWVRYTGVSKMPMGASPAGSKYDMTVVHVSKFKDSKVTDHWEYMAMADMIKMMPPPPPNK